MVGQDSGLPQHVRTGMLSPFDETAVTRRRRRLPHWTVDGATYFVTFRLAAGRLADAERRLIRDHIVAGHGRFYRLAAVIVMPDHAHLLLRPIDGYTLSRVMQGMKSEAAMQLHAHRGTAGPVWQAESWDRIIRDEAEFEEKLGYMVGNPVKAGLAEVGTADPGWWADPGDPVGQDSGLPRPELGMPESCPTINTATGGDP